MGAHGPTCPVGGGGGSFGQVSGGFVEIVTLESPAPAALPRLPREQGKVVSAVLRGDIAAVPKYDIEQTPSRICALNGCLFHHLKY